MRALAKGIYHEKVGSDLTFLKPRVNTTTFRKVGSDPTFREVWKAYHRLREACKAVAISWVVPQ